MRRTYTGEEINESENNSIAGPRPSPFQSSCFFAPLYFLLAISVGKAYSTFILIHLLSQA